MWLDEILAVLNFQQYGFFELFQPAEIPQWAPIGFLASTRVLITLFGDSEYVYRLLPFIVGCVSLFLFYRLSKNFLEPITTLYCNLLFSLSTSLSFYSNEFKPYIFDVASGILLATLLLPFLKKKMAGHEALIIGLTGSSLIWFSYTIIFVMAGIGTVVAMRFLLLKESSSLKNTFLMIGLWIASFGINYSIFLKDISDIPNIANYWGQKNHYMPLIPSSYSDLLWFKDNAFRYFDDVAGVRKMGIFLFGCYCLGNIYFITKKEYYNLLYLTMPIAIVLIASALKLYPFSGRLVIFTAPFALIIAGASFELLRKTIKKRGHYYTLGLMVISLLPASIVSAKGAIYGDKFSEVRDILIKASVHIESDDLMVCHPYKYPFSYYSEKLDIDIHGPRYLDMENLSRTLTNLEKEAQGSSIWLGISFSNKTTRDEVLPKFRHHFQEVKSYTDVRASLHQFKKR